MSLWKESLWQGSLWQGSLWQRSLWEYAEYFLANFNVTLDVTKGTGPITYSRASAYYNIQDAYWTKVLSGVPGYTDLLGIDIHPLSTNKCECWGFPRAGVLGADLIINGSFGTDTVWNKEAGWTISGGMANSDGSTGHISQFGILERGKIYLVTYDIVNYVSGTVTAKVGSTTGTVESGNGTYSEYLLSTGLHDGVRFLSSSFIGSIDNISTKECIDCVGTKAYYDSLSSSWYNYISGMTLSGDTAAVLSIIEDQVALEAMTVEQLDNLVNGWKDYNIATGAGGSATVTFTGAMAATATSMSAYVRVLSGSCVIQDSTGTYDVTPSGTAFVRYKEENFTPTAGSTMQIVVAASSQVRFLVPQVESLPYTTPLNPSEGATSTRAAIDISAPMTGNYPLTGSRHIPILEWTPSAMATGVAQCLWSSVTDANNEVSVWATGDTEVKVEKKVGGVSEYTTYTGTFAVGATYTVDSGFNADNTMFLKIDNVDAQGDTSTTAAPVFAATQWIGSHAGASHMCGNIKNVRTTN